MPKSTQRVTEAERLRSEPWRKWYRTERWARLRLRVFRRDAFTCKQPGCGKLELNTARLVAHHKRAHHGNPELFWDEANVVTACKPCHDGPIQASEKGGVSKGPSYSNAIGRDGWPTDPRHPANR